MADHFVVVNARRLPLFARLDAQQMDWVASVTQVLRFEPGEELFRQGEVAAAQAFLATFDRVFAVLEDNDAEKLRALGYAGDPGALSDHEVEKKVAARQTARQQRDFAASDRIRKELADRGILIEDSRDGSVRWKRK